MARLDERTGLKQCSSCKHYLPPERFHKNLYPLSTVVDGLSCQCSECRNGKAQQRRAIKREITPPKHGPAPKLRTGELPGSRFCIECKQSLAPAEFYSDKQRPDGVSVICKTCTKARRKRFYGNNKEKMNSASVKYRRRLRLKVFAAYGGKCACCGESRPDFLSVDHVNGGGAAHRRSENLKAGPDTDRWLAKNNFPSGFRVLCHNCNMARGFYGHCPHESGLSAFSDLEV